MEYAIIKCSLGWFVGKVETIANDGRATRITITEPAIIDFITMPTQSHLGRHGIATLRHVTMYPAQQLELINLNAQSYIVSWLDEKIDAEFLTLYNNAKDQNQPRNPANYNPEKIN